jgi:serine/threonine-protein kinase
VTASLRGTTLKGRYRVDELLGEGGMGQVWRGHDVQLGRTVAIKVFAEHVMARADAVARFEREARVGAALGHPNVVHTYDFGEDAGRWFLVMQLVEGGSLLDYRLAHRPLPAPTIMAFASQLAEALVATHAIGLVHRDLKPENVLVDQSGPTAVLRVTDFGMAYIIAPTDAKQGRLTQDGSFGGTPEYMAPEQVSGGVATAPADVYALGCMLFELALDCTPFEGGGVGRIFAGHLYAPPPPLAAARPDLPHAFEELVHRMLAKNPSDRPSPENVRRRLAMMEMPGAQTSGRYGVVSDRRARMISTPNLVPPEPSPHGSVAIEGALDRDLEIAIAAAGLHIVADAADVYVMLGATLEQIAQRTAQHVPVIADAPRGDFQRISGLLRLGVADVVLSPLVPASLVRALTRTLRKKLGVP